jgi:hypothetical protein
MSPPRYPDKTKAPRSLIAVSIRLVQRYVRARRRTRATVQKPFQRRGEVDDEDDDGHWWWQLEAGKPEKWKVPQWEVLAANRVGWEARLKEVKVNERDGSE